MFILSHLKDKIIDIIKLKKIKKTTKERKIHEWEVSDECGWRSIELWEIGGKLELFAFDADGEEVKPRI